MQLNITPYSIKGFSHSKRQQMLAVEASDMQFRGPECLYDDACDVGIALINPRTGNVTHWYLEDTLANQEPTAWLFKPCTESIYKHPMLKGYELHIIND